VSPDTLTARAVAELTGGRLVGDGGAVLSGIAPLDRAGPGDLSFLASGRYLDAFRQPERFLATAMMGVTIAHVTASSVATWALVPRMGASAALVATLVLTPLMLIVGEVIPKAVAREWATALVLRLFRTVEIATALLAPLSWGANALVGGALAALGYPRTTTRASAPLSLAVTVTSTESPGSSESAGVSATKPATGGTLSATTILAPSRAMILAPARPMPDAPPVTIATLPDKSVMV